MKTLLALLFSLTLSATSAQVENDTLIVRDTIQLNGIPLEIAQERLLHWFAFKCDDWRQVIHIKKNNRELGYYYLKLKNNIPKTYVLRPDQTNYLTYQFKLNEFNLTILVIQSGSIRNTISIQDIHKNINELKHWLIRSEVN